MARCLNISACYRKQIGREVSNLWVFRFRGDAVDVFVLVGCGTALVGSWYPTYRDHYVSKRRDPLTHSVTYLKKKNRVVLIRSLAFLARALHFPVRIVCLFSYVYLLNCITVIQVTDLNPGSYQSAGRKHVLL